MHLTRSIPYSMVGRAMGRFLILLWLAGLCSLASPYAGANPFMRLRECGRVFSQNQWHPPVSSPIEIERILGKGPDTVGKVRAALTFLAGKTRWHGVQKAQQWEILAQSIAAEALSDWRSVRVHRHPRQEILYQGRQGWTLAFTPEGSIYKGRLESPLDPTRPLWTQLWRWQGLHEVVYIEPIISAHLDVITAPAAAVIDGATLRLLRRADSLIGRERQPQYEPPQHILARFRPHDRWIFVKNWQAAQNLIQSYLENQITLQRLMIEDLNEVLSYAIPAHAEGWLPTKDSVEEFLPADISVFADRDRYTAFERVMEQVRRAESENEHPVRLAAMVLQGISYLQVFPLVNLCTAVATANWILMKHGYPPYIPRNDEELKVGFDPHQPDLHPREIIKKLSRNIIETAEFNHP